MTQAAPAPSATEPHVLPRPRATQQWASLRQAYDLALAGALGALFGLYLYVELVQAESVYVRDALAGLIIGGSIGFFLSAWGPFRDGAWHKLARAVSWGVPAAALGGAIGLMLGELVIGLLRGGLLGRACSWSVLGLGIGLGQGLADRSRQRLIFGLIGGGLGGFVGGCCFELLRVALGNRYDLGQALGIVILGGGLGLFLALVEQALRRAWVQVQSGRQEGRIYLLGAPALPPWPGRTRRDRHLRRSRRRPPARRDRGISPGLPLPSRGGAKALPTQWQDRHGNRAAARWRPAGARQDRPDLSTALTVQHKWRI